MSYDVLIHFISTPLDLIIYDKLLILSLSFLLILIKYKIIIVDALVSSLSAVKNVFHHVDI